jgi:hypothetical protein
MERPQERNVKGAGEDECNRDFATVAVGLRRDMFLFLRFWVLSVPFLGFVPVIGYVNIVASQAYNRADSERKQGGFHGRNTEGFQLAHFKRIRS